ncbi:MAG: hypothetical protein FJX00_01365 [Alphaproteobacteria bacterium]|nr:hypothetical protein [Alphaproteobacteria bacterium]
MKKMTYLMMLALSVSAVSSNINAKSEDREQRKQDREQRKQDRKKRKEEVKKNFKNTCKKAGSRILKGEIVGAIGELKKGMDQGIDKWKTDGTLLPLPPQVIDEIKASADEAVAQAEKLANAGNKQEAKEMIDNLPATISAKFEDAAAAAAVETAPAA